ncbi:transcriptional repressor CTCFL-like isoform X2 [Wyeomyia smithii]|nr:transcriptional repressor CTCFL-like isoform X2 [Wyeomyia smithii]
MENLFDNDDNQLIKKIAECTAVRIAQANGVVSSICHPCKTNLLSFYKFRKKCIQSEVVFLNELKNIRKLPAKQCNNTNKADMKNQKDFLNPFATIGPTRLDKACSRNSSENKADRVTARYALAPVSIFLKPLIVKVKNKKYWNCPSCDKKFKELRTFKNHINTHKGNRSFICNFCERSFSKQEELNLHMRKLHDNKMFFTSKDIEVAHLKYKCRQIPATIPLKPLLINVNKKQLWKCPKCEKRFQDLHCLSSHISTHTMPYTNNRLISPNDQKINTNFDWNKCLQSSPTPVCVMLNPLTVNIDNKELWKCPKCEKCFQHLGDMEEHVNIHRLLTSDFGRRPWTKKCHVKEEPKMWHYLNVLR